MGEGSGVIMEASNGSAYIMDWKNVQTLIYNPPVYGNTTFGVAGPDYRIKGAELQIVARVTDYTLNRAWENWARRAGREMQKEAG